ncbi:MAG: hypothetical protein WCI72_04190 [archaeon]
MNSVIDRIPGVYVPYIDRSRDGENPRRLTLLHKQKGGLVCLLSRGMEEVAFDKPIEDAFLLTLYGPKEVKIAYQSEITLSERKLPDGSSYLVVNERDATSDKIKPKRIPFARKDYFLSEFVQPGKLDGKLDSLIEIANERLTVILESIADSGFIRGTHSKKVKENGVKYDEVGAALFEEVAGLFHEEKDSVPVRKHDFYALDVGLKRFMSKPKSKLDTLKGYAQVFGYVLPAISLLPACAPEYIAAELKSRYEKRFSVVDNEKERAAIALSEFALANPKLLAGVKRGYSDLKAFGSLQMSLVQLGLTYGACELTPWLGIPMVLGSAMSGATIVRNAVRSGGTDFSGVTASLLNKLLINNLRKKGM